jgi:hypothetical protein
VSIKACTKFGVPNLMQPGITNPLTYSNFALLGSFCQTHV